VNDPNHAPDGRPLRSSAVAADCLRTPRLESFLMKPAVPGQSVLSSAVTEDHGMRREQGLALLLLETVRHRVPGSIQIEQDDIGSVATPELVEGLWPSAAQKTR